MMNTGLLIAAAIALLVVALATAELIEMLK
jgi:hypothetical protein